GRRTAPRPGSRSPRSPDTSGPPGRSGSPSSCRWGERSRSSSAHLSSKAEDLLDLGLDLRLLERLALDLVEALRVHEVLRAEDPDELAQVHLRHHDPAVALHHL